MPCRIGTDESGKGDFFGYLTVAAVCVDEKTSKQLAGEGVRDSKKLSDKRIMKLEKKIKKTCPHEVVRISPEKYNKLYSQKKNLNAILGWAHARAIENLLERGVECEEAVADQFGDRRVLEESLMEKGRKIKLVQKTHAEEDTAVAAASVLARAEFLRTLDMLSARCGVKLPKGATSVEKTAKHIAETLGIGFLEKVAKTHFKTMARIKTG